MVRAKEDDLFELAAKAGKEEEPPQDGLSLKPVFLGPESGRVDEGFQTRVRPPTDGKRSESSSSGDKKQDAGKKAIGRPRGTTAERTATDIAETLEEKVTTLFAPVVALLPVTGTYGIENAPKAIGALISIGKRRPAVMKALMKAADGADTMEIGRYIAGVAMAVQVDMGRIPGDHIVAKAVGVTEVIEKYFVENPDAPINYSVTEQVTHAARFQPVS